jgi:glycosyltransferase involved in cell wall biosynthesis
LNTGARAAELRVMIVTDQYQPMVGGVPAVTSELARGLAERGHAVAVIAPGTSVRGPSMRGTSMRGTSMRGGRAGDAEPAAGQPGAGLAVDYRGSLPWPWYEGQRLGLLPPAAAGQAIDEFAPDVLHLHSPLTLGLAARRAARRRGVPVIYTNHYLPLNVWPAMARTAAGQGAGTPGTGRPGTVARLGSRARDAAFYGFVTGFANRCDLVTAPTATALRLLREHGLRVPSRAVSNGVDLERFSPGARDEALRARYGLPAGRPVIVSVGRLSPEKRADVLIAALARLGDSDSDSDTGGASAGGYAPVLALAGSGPEDARLRSLARHYGVAGRVRFLGFVPDDDLPGLYRLADVFAIASPAELQSLVTMAAMASGLPVVAVDAGALAELVHAGENGFLARPGRAGHVADCLGLLCRDRELRARMGKASARIIADHDRHLLLARWESIYRGLVRRGTAEHVKVSDGQP